MDARVPATFDPKVIKELSAQITLAYPIKYDEVDLTVSSPTGKIDNHIVALKRLSPNQVELRYSSEVEDRIVDASAWHTDGKALAEQKSSGNTLPNEGMFNYFSLVKSHYETTLDALTSGEFVSAEFQDVL